MEYCDGDVYEGAHRQSSPVAHPAPFDTAHRVPRRAGSFSDGKKHGSGMYKHASGSFQLSEYAAGKEVGEGLRMSQGRTYRMVDGHVRKSQGSISDDDATARTIAAQVGVDPTVVNKPPPSAQTYSERVTSRSDEINELAERSFSAGASFTATRPARQASGALLRLGRPPAMTRVNTTRW